MRKKKGDDNEVRMVPGIPRPVGPGDTFDPETMDPTGWAEGRYHGKGEVRIYSDADAIVINAAHRRAISHMGDALKSAAECGRLLIEKKATVGRGGWLAWVEANCEFSQRQVNKYMALGAKVQNGTGSSNLNFAPTGEGNGMINRAIDAMAAENREKKGEDGLTPKQRACCEWIQAHPGCEIQHIMAAGFSRGTAHACRKILGQTRANRTDSTRPKSRNRVRGRRAEPAQAPKIEGEKSFVEKLPKRGEWPDETEDYLNSLAVRRVLDSRKFDDDAAIYHAIEPMLRQIPGIIRDLGIIRVAEMMGPFYRLLHALLRVNGPETWEACDACASRKHKDGTCRKCKGCGYLI